MVPMHAKERAAGLYPMLSTAAARWRPAEPWGRVARGGELQRMGKWVQEFTRVPRGAVGEAGSACGPPRWRAALDCAGGGEAEREARG